MKQPGLIYQWHTDRAADYSANHFTPTIIMVSLDLGAI